MNYILILLLIGFASCQCQDGYIWVETGCRLCQNFCSSCTNGLCDQCPTSYYGDNKHCYRCYTGCTSCTDYQICTSCQLPYYFLVQNTCQSCSYPCVTCDSQGACLTCVSGYTVVGNKCEKCERPCSLCSGAIYKCTSCYQGSTQQYYLSGQACLSCEFPCESCISKNQCTSCNQGYYMNQSQYCIKCNEPCLQCNSSITCLSCINTKYYIAPNNNQCLTCNNFDSNCLTCQAYNICTSCHTGYFIQDDFIGSQYISTCKQCSTQCLTCSNDQNECLSCNNAYSPPTCKQVCNSSEFQLGILCYPCSSQCKTCELKSIQCLSCSLDRISPPLCTCKENYFEENGVCKPCIADCKFCINNNSCSKCVDGYYLQRDLCVQQCDNLYYITRDYKCILCNINHCIECNINGVCNQCDQNYLLYRNQCYFQKCNQGYYTTDNENCLNCDKNCYNCLNQSNNCVECYNGYQLLEDNQIFNCVVECPLNYYIVDKKCQRCNSNCQQCSSENVCTSCIVGQFLLNNQCHPSCPTFYYQLDQKCLQCPNNCEKCYGDYCYVCSKGYYSLQNTCLEYCPEGYYGDNNLFCQPCQKICKACVNDHECISCNAPLFFKDNTCFGQCPISYYRDLVDNRCKQCIEGCEICENETFCYKCLENFAAFKNRCVIECDIGYYIEDQYCRECDFDCYTCYGPTKYDCIICKYGLKLYKSLCLEDCPKNTVFKNNQCKECHETCETCFDSGNQNCLTCKTEYILLNNACYAYCPSQYYKNSGHCLKCQDNCDICINSISCLRCLSNFYFNNGNCLSVCPNGYYGYDGVCEKCHFSCRTCNGGLQNNCLSCSQTLVYQNNECLPGCLNYYYQNAQNICNPCMEGCATCINDINCTECIYNLYLHPLTKNCVLQCNNGYMHNYIERKCLQCYTGCQSCFGQSINQCLTCFSNYYFYQNQCWVSQCPISTYQMQDICISCDSHCMTCDAKYPCISCLTGYFYFNSKCIQKCPDGYFGDSTNQSCVQCKQNCRICDNANNCSYCYNVYTNNGIMNYFLLNNDCVSTCPYNYDYFLFECTQKITQIQMVQDVAQYCYDDPTSYLDINQNLCVSCNQDCDTCYGSQSNQCLSCLNYLYHDTCVVNCKLGTFLSGFQCLDCHKSCNSCVQNNRIDFCTSCYNSAYLQLVQGQLGRCVNMCDVGYYHDYSSVINGQTICSLCFSNCLTCINYNYCTSCVEPKILKNGECVDQCDSDEFVSKVDNQCYKCKDACSSCTDSLTCTGANQNYQQTLYLQNGQAYASCGLGYYTQGSQCFSCQPNCETCNDYNTCTKCNSSTVLYNSNCVYGCSELTYFDNGTCKLCHDNCLFCYDANETSCIQCKTGLKYIVIYDSISSTYKAYCQDSCLTNYTYNILLKICLYNSCHNECLTCVGDQQNQCVTCPSNFILNQITSKYGTCVSGCPSGMYNDKGICQNCNDYCQQCTAYTSCTACKSNAYHLNKQLCVIQCPLGYYQNYDTQTCELCDSDCYECIYPYLCVNQKKYCSSNQYLYQNNCINCHWTCKTCDGPTEFDCTSCGYVQQEQRYKYQTQCLLICPKGLYNSSQCLLCPENCEVCQSDLLCTSCFIGYFLQGNNCVQDCGQHYFANEETQKCQSCYDGCLECVGPGPYQCVVCEPNYLLSDNRCLPYCPYKYFYNLMTTKCEYCNDYILHNQCVNQCPQQYYPVNNVCTLCTNNCTSCQTSLYLYQNTCISNCIVGTYNVNGICYQCDIQCNSCQNESDQCQQCSSVTRYNPPFCECQIGYQQDSPNKDCIQCATQCHSCKSNFKNCIQCKSDRISNPPACTCPYGKYDNGLNCVSCKHECDDCLSNTVCLYCKGDRVGRNCVCRLGYYDDGQSLYCRKCDHSCSTCTKNGCTECLGNRILNTNKQCLCQQGYYEDGESVNCLKCHFKCLTCIDNQYHCIECKGDRKQLPFCKCADGYFDDEVNVNCQQCLKECVTCNKASCLICKANRFGSICDCPPGGIDRQDVGYMHCETCELGLPTIQMQINLTTLIIKFGKQVTFDFEQGCFQIIDVSILGVNPKCSINNLGQIVIELGINNSIQIGDLIQLFTKIKGIDCDLPYTTIFPTNVLPPYIINDSDIMIFGPSQVSTCENTKFYVSQYFFDGHNGFKMVSWSLESFQPYNQLTQEQMFGIFYEVNLYKQTNVTIPPYVLTENTTYKFKYQFINYLGQQQAKYIEVQCLPIDLPLISIQFEDQLPQVYYINNRIAIKATILKQSTCDELINVNTYYKMQVKYKNNVIISDKQFYFKHSSEKYVELIIQPYTFTQAGYYEVFLIASFDQLNTKQKSITVKMLLPGIYAKIYGGNQIHSFGQSFNITAIVKDLNIKENQSSGIQYTWNCVNAALDKPCESVDEQPFILKNQQVVLITSRTLAPFNSYIFFMRAQKNDVIITTSSIMTIVDVEISTFSLDTPFFALNTPVIFNQELLFEVSSLHTTNLYGCLIYDFQKLSVFSIPYNTFAINLQNLLKYRYEQVKIQIFSTDSINYTPLLTSVEITTIQPSLNCKFNIFPQQGIAFETNFKFEIKGCVDVNSPIYFKFIFYYDQTQYQQDMAINSYMNSDLIIDYQTSNTFTTILPKSTYSHSIIIAIIQNQLGAQTSLTNNVIVGQDLMDIDQKYEEFQAEININQTQSKQRILYDQMEDTLLNLYENSKVLEENQYLSMLNILTIGVAQFETETNHLNNLRSILFFELQIKIDLPLITETTKMQIKKATTRVIVNSTTYLEDFNQFQIYLQNLDQSLSQSINNTLLIMNSISRNEAGYRDYQQKEREKTNMINQISTLDFILKSQSDYYYDQFNGNISQMNETILKNMSSNFEQIQDLLQKLKYGLLLVQQVNADPIKFSGSSFSLIFNRLTTEIMNEYLSEIEFVKIVDKPIDNSTNFSQSLLLNFSYFHYKDNPFVLDSTYPNNTHFTSVQSIEPSLQNGSLLIPTQPITTKYNVTINRQKRLLQQYQDLFLLDEQPNYVDFKCTNKYFQQWESNFCKTTLEIDVYSSLIISCDCQYFGPTSISSTLADILQVDKFSKSFSIEAIVALNNFPFYRSIIFYCLVIITFLLVLVLPYGIKKDQLDRERAMPQHLIESEYIRKMFEDRQKQLQKEMEKIKEERHKEWKEFQEKQNFIEIITDDKEQKQQYLDKDEQIQEVVIAPDIDPDEMIDQQQQQLDQSDNSNNFNLDINHDSDEEFQFEDYPPINISNKQNKKVEPSPYAKFFQYQNPYSLNNTIVTKIYQHSSSGEDNQQSLKQNQIQKNLNQERHSSRIQSDQFSIRNSENIQQIILKKSSYNQSKFCKSLNSQVKINDYPPLSPNSASPIGVIYDNNLIVQPNFAAAQSGSEPESHINSYSTKLIKSSVPQRKSQEQILFLDHEFYEEDSLSIEEKEKVIQIWYLEKKRNKLLEEGFKLRFTLKNIFLFLSLFQSILSIIAIFDKKLPRPIRFFLIYMTFLTTCYINIFFQVDLNPGSTIAYSVLSSILSVLELMILTFFMPHQYLIFRIIGWIGLLGLTAVFSYLIIVSMAFEAQDSGGDVSRSNQWGINFIISFLTMNLITDPLQLIFCFKIIQFSFNNASPQLKKIFIMLCMSKHFNIYFDFLDY